MDINANVKFSRKDYQAPSYQMNQVYYHSMPRRRPSNPVYTPDGIFNKESQLNEMDHGGMYFEDLDVLYQQLQLVVKPLKDWQIIAEANYRIDRTEKHTDVQLIMEKKEDGSYFAMARDDGYGGRSFVKEEALLNLRVQFGQRRKHIQRSRQPKLLDSTDFFLFDGEKV